MSSPLPDIAELSISAKSGEQFEISPLLDLYLSTPVKTKDHKVGGTTLKSTQHKLWSTQHKLLSKILSQQKNITPALFNEKFENFANSSGLFAFVQFIHNASAYRSNFMAVTVVPSLLDLSFLYEKLVETIISAGFNEAKINLATSVAYSTLKNVNLSDEKRKILIDSEAFQKYLIVAGEVMANDNFATDTRLGPGNAIAFVGKENDFVPEIGGSELSTMGKLIYSSSLISNKKITEKCTVLEFITFGYELAKNSSAAASLFARCLGELYSNPTIFPFLKTDLAEKSLELVLQFCEHPIENVRHHASIIFEAVVKHAEHIDLGKYCDQLPYDKRFRYVALSICTKYGKGVSQINVEKLVDAALLNRSVCSSVSAVFLNLLAKREFYDIHSFNFSEKIILELQNQENTYSTQKLILDVILPKLFKNEKFGSKLAQLILKSKSIVWQTKFQVCHIVLAAINVAWGKWNDETECWNDGMITKHEFLTVFKSNDEGLKYAALRIIADVRRPGKAISRTEYEIISETLDYQMNGQSADFRVNFVQLILFVLKRGEKSLKNSRKYTKNPESKDPESKNPESKNPETTNPEAQNPDTDYPELLKIQIKSRLSNILNTPGVVYGRLYTTCSLWKELFEPDARFIKLLWCSFKDVAKMAFSIVNKLESLPFNYLQVLKSLKENTKPHAVASLSLLVQLCPDKDVNDLISIINQSLDNIESDIVTASVKSPPYGLLEVLNSEEISVNNLSKIEELAHRAASLFMPVVGSAAPEGGLPYNENDENWTKLPMSLRKIMKELAFNTEDTSLRRASQLVLISSWRSMREVSALFGKVAGFYCENENFEKVNEYFELMRKFLLDIRHKGAMEMQYEALLDLCEKVHNSSDDRIRKLPKVWLEGTLEALRGNPDWIQKLCSTRRSAGLPLLVNAILQSTVRKYYSTGKGSDGRKTSLIEYGLEELMKYAKDNDDVTKMHCMNTLRWIFKDSKMGETTNPMAGQGFIVSLENTKSNNWSVRTSSTLFFASLARRLFGVEHDNDESLLNRKYKMSWNELYTRYESLCIYLHEELKRKTIAPDTLYPMLLFISKLYLTNENVKSNHLAEILSSIQNSIKIHALAGNQRISKVRGLGARAYLATLAPSQVYPHVLDLISDGELEGESEDAKGEGNNKSQFVNKLSGHIILLKNLVEYGDLLEQNYDRENVLARIFYHLEKYNLQNNFRFSEGILPRIILKISNNDQNEVGEPNFLNALYFVKFTTVFEEVGWLYDHIVESGVFDIEEALLERYLFLIKCNNWKTENAPMQTAALKKLTTISVKYAARLVSESKKDEVFLKDVILALLSSSVYEVRLETFNSWKPEFNCLAENPRFKKILVNETNHEVNTEISKLFGYYNVKPSLNQVNLFKAYLSKTLDMNDLLKASKAESASIRSSAAQCFVENMEFLRKNQTEGYYRLYFTLLTDSDIEVRNTVSRDLDNELCFKNVLKDLLGEKGEKNERDKKFDDKKKTELLLEQFHVEESLKCLKIDDDEAIFESELNYSEDVSVRGVWLIDGLRELGVEDAWKQILEVINSEKYESKDLYKPDLLVESLAHRAELIGGLFNK